MKFLTTAGMVAGTRTQEQQGSLAPLNKCVENGFTYRAYLPVIKTNGEVDEEGVFHPSEGVGIDDTFDIQAFTIPAYKMDLGKMGTTLLPIQDYTVSDSGKVIDNGQIPKISRMSSLLFEAEFRKACKKREDELREEAKEMGTEPNPATIKDARDAIDIEYHGKKVADTMVPPKYNEAVSSMKICIFTSGLIYKLEQDLKPTLNTDIKGFNVELNKKRTNQFKTAVSTAMTERKNKLKEIEEKKLTGKELTEEELNYRSCLDDGYIELLYVYSGTDKKDAGNSASFTLCGDETDSSKKKFPEFWKKNYDSIKARLIYDMELMASKNNNIAKAPTEAQVMQNFHKYCATNAVLGAYINFEGDELKAVTRCAEDFFAIDGFKANAKFYNKLSEIIEEKKAKEAANGTTTEVEEVTEDDKVVGDVLKAVKENGGAMPLNDLINIAGSEDALDKVAGGMEVGEL